MDYTSNISVVVAGLQNQLQGLRNNPEPVLRACAIAVIPEMQTRIHKDGKDSSGNQIGTYSPGYMKVRTGDFANSGRLSRGKNKGKLKNSGTFTEATIRLDKKTGVFSGEEKVGTKRPNYQRSADTKVIVSLTRQLENDYAVVPTENNGVGIGFNNPLNLQKARWVEETYKKPILTQLTKEEEDLVTRTATEFLPEYLKTFE